MSFDTYIGIVFAAIIAVGVAFIPVFCGAKFFNGSNRKREHRRKGKKNNGNIISFIERKHVFQESTGKQTKDCKVLMGLAAFGVLLIIVITVIYVVRKPSVYINTSDNVKNEAENQSEADDFTVTASYDMNTAQTSFIGINVLINAKTSFPAEHVTISAISDTEEYGVFDMHGDLYNWQYVANFYKKGTYIVTVTAYNSESKSVSDEFIYVY